MVFWGVAILLAVLGVAPVLAALLRPRGADLAEPPQIALYRDQLAEVERDLARGVLTPEDVARTRIEVQRRLLDADRAPRDVAGTAPPALTGAVVTLVAVAVLGGGAALYLTAGAPGYGDLPVAARLAAAAEARANRPSQEMAVSRAPTTPAPAVDPGMAALMEQLRTALATRPDDLKGFALLARNEAGMGDLAAAIAAQTRVTALRGDPQDHAQLGEYMVAQAGGYVSPQAEAAFDTALTAEPGNGTARYYKGMAQAQTGRPDIAFRLWRDLLDDSTPDAPWLPAIRAQLPELADRAGLLYDLPLGEVGPDQSMIAAADGMTETERAAMINTMVTGLADRLATQGGTSADWARLIAAYGVLNRTDAAAAIWTEAQQVFNRTPADLDLVRAAARAAGVAE